MKTAIMAGWDDIPHLSAAQKGAMLESIPPWQRDARSKGAPQLGSGAIWSVPESEFAVAPIQIQPHWPRCFALDVGFNRSAALWAAHDRDTGNIYVYDELYRAKTEASVVASAIVQRGRWIPGVVDPAARGRSQKDGVALIDVYRDLGLDLEIAINTVEAGILKVWELLSAGRLKVFKTCGNLFAEYRLYRRDELGRVVKTNDHLMDALRYLCMSGLDRAIVEPKVSKPGAEWWRCKTSPVWAG